MVRAFNFGVGVFCFGMGILLAIIAPEVSIFSIIDFALAGLNFGFAFYEPKEHR